MASILPLLVMATASGGAFPEQIPSARAPVVYTKASHHREPPAPEGPLHIALSRLKEHAEAGDGNASAAIHAGLAKCRALREHPLTDLAFNYCGGVSDDEVKEAGSWLMRAAGQGNEAAMFVFATTRTAFSTPDATHTHRPSMPTDDKQRAAQHLYSLANRCHVDAIAALYRQRLKGGPLFAQDLRAAYVLQRELLELYVGLIASGEQAALTGKLSVSELAEAQNEASAFLELQCR